MGVTLSFAPESPYDKYRFSENPIYVLTMNLRRLEYFLVVVEEGSISLAARRLHMTQPPLSQAIQALEREVGAELLRRLPRGVEPTPAGLLLADRGRDLLRGEAAEHLGESRVGEERAGQRDRGRVVAV